MDNTQTKTEKNDTFDDYVKPADTQTKETITDDVAFEISQDDLNFKSAKKCGTPDFQFFGNSKHKELTNGLKKICLMVVGLSL